jgi:hypothetical protein
MSQMLLAMLQKIEKYLRINLEVLLFFMSLCIKFTNSFSISKNAFIDEYREFSGGMIIIFPQKDILSVKADQIILDENF